MNTIKLNGVLFKYEMGGVEDRLKTIFYIPHVIKKGRINPPGFFHFSNVILNNIEVTLTQPLVYTNYVYAFQLPYWILDPSTNKDWKKDLQHELNQLNINQ